VIAAVVLAAGGSSRMGRPKQLIAIDGRSLIRHAVESAIDGGCDPVIVVVGAEAERVGQEIRELRARVAVNPIWRTGLASSIRRGMSELEEPEADVEAVLLMGSDQPRISSAVIRRLLRAYREREDRTLTMAACDYGETLGSPAVFGRECFGRLGGLAGDRGAQLLLREGPERVIRVPWSDGALDVDRPEDLERT
jgi:molybdenum cofactor cytidylyltransferase